MANEVEFKMTFSGDQLTQDVWHSAFSPRLKYSFYELPFVKRFADQKDSIEGLRHFEFSSDQFMIEGASKWQEPSVLFELIARHLIELSGGPIYALITYREEFDHAFGTACLITDGDELKCYSSESSSRAYKSKLSEAFPRFSEDSFRWDYVDSRQGVSAEAFVEFQVDRIICEQKQSFLTAFPVLSTLITPNVIVEKNLRYRRGSSDKVYHAYLSMKGDGYLVTAQYGKSNAAKLTESVKTKDPVPLEKAEKIYHKLIHSKRVKGYQ